MPTLRFSVFEMTLVGVILAVVVGITLMMLDPLDKIGKANDTKVQYDIAELARALDRYALLHDGYYPTGSDVQQKLIETGEINSRLIPPDDYRCDGSVREYVIEIGRNAKISCMLHSKLFTKLNHTHWVWCSDSGKAGPSNGECT